jgi:hypothetical protein
LDRKDAPENQWHLAQDYLAHAQNLAKIINSNGKYQNRYQGGGNNRHISYPDVLFV